MDRSAPDAERALGDLLDELTGVLITLDPHVYTARPLGSTSGTIGQHVRHALDHVAALLTLAPSATLTYDSRARGTAVEIDPGAALREVFRLKAALVRWAERSLDEPVAVSSLVGAGNSVLGWSTLARELAFVVSHTIHHQAMVACLLAFQGLATPERFGYAPSTPRA